MAPTQLAPTQLGPTQLGPTQLAPTPPEWGQRAQRPELADRPVTRAHALKLHLLSVRRAHAGDDGFLRDLFADSRPDLARLPLPQVQLDQLLELQRSDQQARFRVQFPSARDHLIMVRGAPVGRCWTWRCAWELRLLDIAVHTGWRRRGIGRAVIADLCETAAAEELPVRLSVWNDNTPALGLYRDMGFSAGADVNGHLPMEWVPPATAHREPSHCLV